MSLKVKALDGVKWTTISSITATFIQVLQIGVLARFLTKEDFGLFATISVVLGFAAFFIEAGMGSAVIHRQNATKEELGTAYFINVSLGWVVWLSVYFLAIPIAKIYQNEQLIELIRLSSITFLIQPFGMQFSALLQRELKFNSLARIEIFTAVSGFVFSVLFAMFDFGINGLIYAQVLNTLLRTAIVLYLGVKLFGFNRSFSFEKAKYFLQFGAFQIGENTVNYFNSQLDVMLIGKLLGEEALGSYYMAKQIVFRPVQVINPIITKVALPTFAAIQEDSERLKRIYLQMVHTLAIVHFAVYYLMAGFTEEIVIVLLGKNWHDAGVLLAILSPYVLLKALGNPIGSLIMAKGRVDLGFYWNIALLFYVPPLLWLGSQWGLEGISCALVFAMLGLQIPAWYFLVYRLCGARFGEYFGRILKNLSWATLCFSGLFVTDDLIVKLLITLIGCFTYIFIYKSNLLVYRK